MVKSDLIENFILIKIYSFKKDIRRSCYFL